LTDAAISALIQQAWKGNVRELKNIMTRLAVLLPSHSIQITPDYLTAYFPEREFEKEQLNYQPTYPVGERDSNDHEQNKHDAVIEVASVPTEEGVFIPIGTSLRDAEELIIQKTLNHTQGNRTKAAKILGIGLRTIRRKVNEPIPDWRLSES
jgi:DNA-binding NtrC family response regulator